MTKSFITCTHHDYGDQVKRIRWAGHVARIRDMKNAN
jgi:hypothetical protein